MGAFRDIELIFSFSQMTSTYVKLQDAHAAETGAVGTWQMIGYIAPGSKTSSEHYETTVFKYTNDNFSGVKDGTTMLDQLSKTESWTATAKTALNECEIASTWSISMEKAGTGSTVKFTTAITPAGKSTAADCKSLTANFGNIAHD